MPRATPPSCNSVLRSKGDPTKVGNLGILAGVQEDILGLEVSVDDHVSVAVVHGRDDLLKKTTRLGVLDLEDTISGMRLDYHFL